MVQKWGAKKQKKISPFCVCSVLNSLCVPLIFISFRSYLLLLSVFWMGLKVFVYNRRAAGKSWRFSQSLSVFHPHRVDIKTPNGSHRIPSTERVCCFIMLKFPQREKLFRARRRHSAHVHNRRQHFEHQQQQKKGIFSSTETTAQQIHSEEWKFSHFFAPSGIFLRCFYAIAISPLFPLIWMKIYLFCKFKTPENVCAARFFLSFFFTLWMFQACQLVFTGFMEWREHLLAVSDGPWHRQRATSRRRRKIKISKWEIFSLHCHRRRQVDISSHLSPLHHSY